MGQKRSGCAAARAALTMLLGLLCLPVPAQADQDSFERAFAVPGHGTLRLAVPAMWQTTLSGSSEGGSPTIEFAPISGGGFLVLVTPMGGVLTKELRDDPVANRRLVEAWGAEHLERAEEKELTPFPVDGAEARGHAVQLTDPSPEPGEFRVVTFGMVTIGDLRVGFTILTQSADHPAIEQALAMIRGARHTGGSPHSPPEPHAKEPAPPGSMEVPPDFPAAGMEPSVTALRKLTFPGRTWSLIVDLPGFEFTRRQTRDDGKGIMVVGENPQTHVLIEIFIKEAVREGDQLACRKYYWKKLRRKGGEKSDVRLSEREGMALVEYLIEEARGFRVNQKNVNAYLSHDGTWIGVYLSKLGFRESEWSLFDEVLQSIRIAE